MLEQLAHFMIANHLISPMWLDEMFYDDDAHDLIIDAMET